MKLHLLAQHVLVRMLHDPAYAEALRADPQGVAPELGELAHALARIDPRALRRDQHRRERVLGELCKELPCATTLFVHERGMEALLAFYGTAHFHEAIAERCSLVLALGGFLQEASTACSPHVAALLAVELASARARRDRGVAGHGLRRAPGVEPVELPAGTLEAVQAIERHRFRLALLPWSAARESPPIALPPLGAPVTLCAVCLGDEVSLVEIERPLYAVLASLPQPRSRDAVLAEAALRLRGDRARAEAALDELIADEMVLP